MNFKEFLKPTWGKIVLFLLIPIFYAQSNVIHCFVGPCQHPYDFMPFIIAIFSYISIYYQNNIVQNIAIGIISSYIIACIINFLYSRSYIKIKGFVKINIWKLVLTILILIFMFKIEFIRMQAFNFCKTCSPDIYESIYQFLSRWINKFILIEIIMLTSYLISCLIVSLFKKR